MNFVLGLERRPVYLFLVILTIVFNYIISPVVKTVIFIVEILYLIVMLPSIILTLPLSYKMFVGMADRLLQIKAAPDVAQIIKDAEKIPDLKKLRYLCWFITFLFWLTVVHYFNFNP